MEPDYDHYEILRKEYHGTEDSFTFRLRGDFVWDEKAFSRAIAAMKRVCEDHEGGRSIEKWITSVFWHMEILKEITLHPEFPKPNSDDYYQRAFTLIEELCGWLFVGTCPVLDKDRHFTI